MNNKNKDEDSKHYRGNVGSYRGRATAAQLEIRLSYTEVLGANSKNNQYCRERSIQGLGPGEMPDTRQRAHLPLINI